MPVMPDFAEAYSAYDFNLVTLSGKSTNALRDGRTDYQSTKADFVLYRLVVFVLAFIARVKLLFVCFICSQSYLLVMSLIIYVT